MMERQFSERQLIRWAVPGWVTLFLMLLLISVHLILDRGFGSCIWQSLPKPDGGTIAAMGAAVIASGFAFGFMLFQIYFAVYWLDWLVPLIGGGVNYRKVVESLEQSKPKMDLLKKRFVHWPVGANKGGTERQRMEASIVAAWWGGINEEKQRTVWEDRNQYLVSIYHSMGATLVGTYLTLILYFLTLILYLIGWLAISCHWFPFAINFVILAVWIIVLFFGRKNTEFSHRSLTENALHYFYGQDMKKSRGSHASSSKEHTP